MSTFQVVSLTKDEAEATVERTTKRVFVYEPQSKYFGYPNDFQGYTVITIGDTENNGMSELTYDSVSKTWPIIKGRKIY